jgi:hypothetical protein
MVDAFHRWVLFCHAEIHSGARNGPRIWLREYINDIARRSDDGTAFRVYEHENRIARVAHVQAVDLPSGNAGVAMVITLGDRRGANPAFVHFRQGHSREAERLEGEVTGLSAHCVIELAEDPDHIGRHRMVIEEARGIGRTPITQLINSELRTISTDRDERFVNPDTGNLNQVRPVIEIWPQQSRQMQEALEHGTLGMIELYDTGHIPAFDEQPEFKVQRRTLKVKVTPVAGGMAGALDRLRAIGREQGYTMMKVNWRLPSGDNGTSETHIDLADIGTALLSRRELITIEHAMAECTHQLDDEFVQAIAALFV